MSNIQHIPLAQLRISPRNARKTGGLAIDDLAASIAAEGLLQNLVVTAANDGHYDVEAGGRRLRALQLLQSEQRLPEALASVPCHVVSDDVAGEASLAENAIREAMHPADQFDAFKALVDAGRRISEVAARFGVSELFVKQRLRLARVRPEFLDMYRADEITLDQLQALATTDNHEVQRQAWDVARGDWERDPRSLRSFITRGRVSGTAPLAVFVGLDAYRAAGGEVVQDLFSTQSWIADAALLDRLALDKLAAKAEALHDAGWSWAEPVLHIDRAELNTYPALPPPDGAITLYADPSHERRLEQVDARIEAIHDIDSDDVDDATDAALNDELDGLVQERVTILSQAVVDWPTAVKATAGAIVTVDSDGMFDLYLGRLRPGQKIGKSGATTAPAPGAAESPKPPKKPELSEAVRVVLSAHRSAAAVARLAQDPTLAHCVLLEQMLIAHWPGRFGNNGLHLSLDRNNDTQLRAVGGADTHKALQAALAERAALIKQVPQKGTLDYLLKQTDTWRLELQAALVASHFSGITGSEQGHPGVDAIHRITGFNMADHWTPASDDFLTRIHADLVTEAVVEAKGKSEATTLTGLKKAERAAQAGKLLAGTGWLPKLLRGPGYGKKPAQTVAKGAAEKASKPTAAKKPAKKAGPKKAVKTAAKKAAKRGVPA